MEAKQEMRHGSYFEISQFIVKKLIEKHAGLLDWLSEKDKQLPYYETENQIYVHAGICEEDEKLWKHATEPHEFLWKLEWQQFFDKFYKVQNFFPYAIPIVLDNEPFRI